MEKIEQSKILKIIQYHLDTFPQYYPQNSIPFLLDMVNKIYPNSSYAIMIDSVETGLRALHL